MDAYIAALHEEDAAAPARAIQEAPLTPLRPVVSMPVQASELATPVLQLKDIKHMERISWV
jgi:hypothetical protein